MCEKNVFRYIATQRHERANEEPSSVVGRDSTRAKEVWRDDDMLAGAVAKAGGRRFEGVPVDCSLLCPCSFVARSGRADGTRRVWRRGLSIVGRRARGVRAGATGSGARVCTWERDGWNNDGSRRCGQGR